MRVTAAAAARLLLLACLLCASTHAQQSATSTLTGIITDPNGAVIPGAQVTATQRATGMRRETTTNDEGLYVLTNLAPGEYDVKVQ
jgi:protocatechuate 3,4-dioxygenase beta subunit